MDYLKDNNIQPTLSTKKLAPSIGHNVRYLNFAQHMQKITRALYLITNISDNENTLVKTACSDSVDATQLLYSLTSGNVLDYRNVLLSVQTQLMAIHSYLEILVENNFISEMNYTIVINEIENIHHSISLHIADTKKHMNLDTSFFAQGDQPIGVPDKSEKAPSPESSRSIDTSLTSISKKLSNPTHIEKTDIKKTTLAISNTIVASDQSTKKSTSSTSKVSLKEKRQNNIINILKQKKDASITDICALFKNCSSKTIQRDLVELIDLKKVVKRGDRRWSTYNLK